MPSPTSVSTTSAAGWPSTENVTIAQRSSPRSWVRHAGHARRAARAGPPRARSTRSRIASRPHGERVVDRDAEPDLGRVVRLPVLEAAGVGADAVGAVGLPLGGVEVEQRRLEPLDQLAAHVEEAGAARAAQELAPGGGEHVAADRARRRPASGRPTGRRRAAAGRRPRGRAAPTAAAGLTSPPWVGTWTSETSLTRSSSIAASAVDVDLAVLVVGHDHDRRAGAVGDLAQRDVVARVLGAAWSGCGRPRGAAASRRPCPTRAWRSRRSRSRRAARRSARAIAS